MNFKEGEIFDLDVIIGERPGGLFNAFLMVEKQGGTYNTDRRGHLILPIFQIAPLQHTEDEATRNSPPDFRLGKATSNTP